MNIRVSACISIFVFCLSCSTAIEDDLLLNYKRLPNRGIIPLSYDVRLLPWMETRNWLAEGECLIDIFVLEATRNVTLHSAFDVSNMNVKVLNNGLEIPILRLNYDEASDQLSILLEEELFSNNVYQLAFTYDFIIPEDADNNSTGFYVANGVFWREQEEDGTIFYTIATQFEDIGARKAFPCFDEPQLKANFRFTIGHREEYTALFNTPETLSTPIENEPNWLWTTFEYTQTMSTYLVAFTISIVEKETRPSVVPFSVYAPASLLSEATLALEAGAHVLQFLGQFWLNFPYPFPKMDLIAVPRHPAGAMENWGLIQFTDELFYHGPDNLVCLFLLALTDQPVSHEKLVIEITAHELAHQWFGNLVTLEWWSQIWLNEAFSTFYSFYGAESYDNILGKFLQRLHTIGTIQGYESDVLSTSLPITADTFDESLVFPNTNIIYRKGAALHNMMLGFLGQAYYLGMRSYVRTYAYRNARNQDFLETMQEAIDAMGTSLPATFEEIMNGFLFQPGVPVVSVVRNQSTVTARQKRFLLDGPDDGTRYMLPFKYKTSSSEESSLEWLLEDEAQLEVDFSSEDDWLLINPDHESYMIVQYDPNEYQRLFAQLESNYFVFNAVQRATIFYDLSFVIEGGLLEPDVAIPILETSYLEQELDEIAWFGILRLHRVLMQIEIPDYEEVFLSKAQVALDRAIELSNGNPPHPNFYDVVIELLETLLESKNNFQTFLESPAWTNAIGRPKDAIFQRRMSQIL